MSSLGGGTSGRPTVAVVGGAVGGLASAEHLRSVADVTLFERQSYREKRVNCGEAINEADLVPLEKTVENGFLNRVDWFDVDVYPSEDRDPALPPLTTSRIRVEEGYITDRNVVERRWATRLADAGVTVRENENVTVSRYRDLVDEYDYVVDATGQPALSLKASGQTSRYVGDIVALNADLTHDYAEMLHTPEILFEGYVGYFWVFPKTETRANVGIGWAGDSRPENYIEAFWAACDRNGYPRPPRDAVNVYTIPRGPSLDPSLVRPEPNVFLVGDAAGIANRYQGEGICQAIRSARLFADLVADGRADEYPRRLFASMKREYLLATLMRGVWEETNDPDLLAAVACAIDGLTVDDVTRRPAVVFARLVRRPTILVRLLQYPKFIERALDAATNRWEYNVPGTHGSQG